MTTEHDEIASDSAAGSGSSASLARTVSDARQHFEAMCIPLRPALHRFCTRMTGSPCDGEDVLQDALITAFYRIDELENAVSFRAWVFRIAHNKCIDLVRARRRKPWLESDVEVDVDAATGGETDADAAASDRERAQRALSHIVTELPPRERACIVLRDVLDWSLEETAQTTGSSIGAVKAALHRARAKLVEAESAPPRIQARLAPAHRAVARAYLAAFNRRDWDAVEALLADDARLEVVHRTEGPFKEASYFINYAKLSWDWVLEIALVDGVERIVHFRRLEEAWRPHAVVELAIAAGKVTLVRDYVHIDYLLRHCSVDSGVATLPLR